MKENGERYGIISTVSRGLLLITIGVVFFLINFGILNWSFWHSVVNLWPLILILLGIGLIISKKIPFSAVLLVFLLALLAYSLLGGNTTWDNNQFRFWNQSELSGGTATLDSAIEEGDEQANINLKLAGTALNIGEIIGAEANNQLIAGEYRWQNNGGSQKPYSLETQRAGNTATVNFTAGENSNGNEQLTLNVSPKVLCNLDISSGAVDGTIDVSNLRVENMVMKTGAGSLDLVFGETGVNTKVEIKGGALEINLEVPDSVGLKVHSTGVVSDSNFMGSGLLNNNDWVSDNYDTAKTKIDVDISSAAGSINLSRTAVNLQ